MKTRKYNYSMQLNLMDTDREMLEEISSNSKNAKGNPITAPEAIRLLIRGFKNGDLVLTDPSKSILRRDFGDLLANNSTNSHQISGDSRVVERQHVDISTSTTDLEIQRAFATNPCGSCGCLKAPDGDTVFKFNADGTVVCDSCGNISKWKE